MVKKEKVIENFIWRLLERFGAQGVTLIVSIVLARILDPEVYGLIALVTVITTLLNVFIDSGLGTALIQKKDADDLDFSTVFFFNVGMCVILYAILFFIAPLISSFYDMPELTSIVRVLGLILIISGVKNIQQAYVSRNMLFKKFFFATIGGTVGAAVVGITMACLGFGVWALVIQYLFNAGIDTVILWITVKWRPKFKFSYARLKSMIGFGSKLLGVSLITTVYNDIRQILIGKFYTPTDLAFYNRGKQFPELINTNINASIDSILLPTMSKSQDDISAVKAITRRSIKTCTYILSPFLVGLAVCGEAFIELLLTEKWLFCVPYMRIFCITFLFSPIFTANYNAYKALGKSTLYLKVSIISKIFGIIVLLVTLPHGVMFIAYGLLVSNFINQVVCTFPNMKLLKYSYPEQIKDILPNLLLAFAMGAIVYTVNFLGLGFVLTLVIQIPIGIIVYVLGSMLFKLESYTYVLNSLKTFLKKRRKV